MENSAPSGRELGIVPEDIQVDSVGKVVGANANRVLEERSGK